MMSDCKPFFVRRENVFVFLGGLELEQLRFSSECKKRWNMSQDEIDEYWSECISDSTVPKGTFVATTSYFYLESSILRVLFFPLPDHPRH